MSVWGPKTRAEAATYRYGQWAGFPSGRAWDSERCAATVADGGRSVLFHQCSRKAGKGPEGLYCGIHAKKADA